MKTIKEIRDSKGIVETSVGDSVSYNSETKTITVINGYHPGNQFVVTDEQLKNNFEDIYFRRAGRGKKIKITTEGPKLVSFWDIYGKELDVKDTKTVNFASGPKTFYITEFEGKEYEVPEDMVEKSIPNNYDGKSVQEVWDSLTPKQREHFITDHFNEINANGNFGTSISLSNMVENLSYNGTNNEGISLPVEVKRSFTKHVSSGQYAKGKKVDLGTAVKGEFTTDGENYFSGWYFESQDWNGFKVPYFEDKEAREVIESLEGLSVGRLYGGKLSDKGWWYAEPGTAPADRTVITGQKIQTTDGEKEVWSIGGFEWTWSLKDEQAGDGAKIEKMENKYYYLKPKALFKDSGGVTFEITGHTPTSLKARRFSEVEKNTPEIEIPYTEVLDLVSDKKMVFEKLPIDKIREFRLLEMEIENIKLNFHHKDSIKTYQAELEQAADKIDKLNAELYQVKKEANTLMDDLGKKSAGYNDSMAAMEAIAKKKERQNLVYKGVDEGEIDANYGSLAGDQNLSKKDREYFKKLHKALLHFEKDPKSKFFNGKAGKGKEVGDSQVDYFIEKFKDKMSGSSKSSALGWLDVDDLNDKEKMIVWNKIQPYISKGQDPAFIPENWTKYKWFKNKAGKGTQVSPCTDCDTKLKSFLKEFPSNTKTWAKATDEMRDLARELREYYNDQNNLEEGDKGYIDGLPFREFKTPSEWNTKAKKQILSTWKKLNKEQKESFASNNSFLNPDND